ncbi:hypothetical protein [Roseicyclus marinus]|nr:hypothetical protein [Roseicyclus marinus]MDG3039748.1 hypothetical protein [Roseicyclus marinus]
METPILAQASTDPTQMPRRPFATGRARPGRGVMSRHIGCACRAARHYL